MTQIKKVKLTPRRTPPSTPALPPGPWITRIPFPQGKDRIDFTEAGLVAARLLAASGGSIGLIASRAGIAKTTLRKIMERDERVRLAYEAGIAEEELILVNGLRTAAANGHAVAALFLLKTRHAYVEGAPPPSEAKTNIVINLPDAYTPADYMKLVSPPEPVGKRQLVRKVTTDDDGGTVR